MVLNSTSSSNESMVKSLLEKLIEDTVADIENNEIFWKLVEKVLQHVPRLDIDINNGIETLGDLAFKFWDDLDFSDADACQHCLIENMPVTDHPKIFVDGKEIHLLLVEPKKKFEDENIAILLKENVPEEVTYLLCNVMWGAMRHTRSSDDQNPAPGKRLKYNDVLEVVCHNNNNMVTDANGKKMKEKNGNNPLIEERSNSRSGLDLLADEKAMGNDDDYETDDDEM